MKFNIWNDFPQKPLPELLDFIVDNRGKTVPTVSQEEACEIVLIATNCIRNENLYPVYEKVRYISKETYEKWFRAHPISGDIIFVNKGTPGRICFCPENIDFCIAQDMMAFRVNSSVLYNKYLLAVLRSREMQEQIRITSVGDTIPHFKKEFLKELTIPLPPMDVQQIIGDYYFKLSEKIELNKKINENLEQQAQALFKNLIADIQERVPFTSVIQVLGGGTPKTGKQEYWNGEIPFFTPKDVGAPYVLTTEKSITPLGLDNCNSRLYPVNTVFLTARGTVGKVSLAGVPMSMNQSCYALAGKDGLHQIIVYHYVLETVKALKHKASGAVFDAIITRDFDTESVPALSSEQIDSFIAVAEPIYSDILNRTIENQRLAALRDTLLPKLMSGEIDVSAVRI